MSRVIHCLPHTAYALTATLMQTSVMDLYAILGLARDADLADIRRAYRRLARRCHPGINPGDRDARARFEQISEAFETLSDPDRRLAYDAGVPRGTGLAVSRSDSKDSTSRWKSRPITRPRPSAICSPAC